MLIASGCFLLFGKKLLQFRYEAGDWRWLVVMGIAEPCLYFLFETSALQYTTAGQAGVITATLPLLASEGRWPSAPTPDPFCRSNALLQPA
jgi:drug/metabolite transporter (DMT)-like permease